MNSLTKFTKEIYTFLQTITISNNYIRDHFREYLDAFYEVDTVDKNNPYFVRLQGEYYRGVDHFGPDAYTGFDDKPMWIKNADINTGDTTKQSLRVLSINNNIIKLELSDGEVFNETDHIGDIITFPLTGNVARIQYIHGDNLIQLDEDIESEYLTLDYEATTEYVTHIHTSSILLSKANLELYTKTAYLYHHSADARTALYNQYPEQTDLIKNILYPCTITFDARGNAVDVGHLKLINYSTEHLDVVDNKSHELTSIVDALTTFLDMFRERWDVEDYYKFEKYGTSMFWTTLWTLLPQVVINQRIKNIHTPQVHTDLLWDYLSSKGLDDYRDVLSREQQLFLYKNIRWLLHARGTNKALNVLIEKLLDPYDVAIVSKMIVLDTDSTDVTCTPKPSIISHEVNKQYDTLATTANSKVTYETTYAKEVSTGLEPDHGPDLLDAQLDKVESSIVSKLPTNLLEFKNKSTDYEIGIEFIQFALETFVYLYSEGKLNYDVKVYSEYISGNIPLTIHDAMALILYSLHNSETPVVTLTEDNMHYYMDKPVLHGTERVIITEDDSATYLGAVVKDLSPADIPNTAIVSRVFKHGVSREDIDDRIDFKSFLLQRDEMDNFASPEGSVNSEGHEDHSSLSTIFLMSDVLPDSIEYDGETKSLFLDAIGDEPLDTPVLTSAEDALTYIETLFERYILDKLVIRNAAKFSTHMAYDKLYGQLVKSGPIPLNIIDGIWGDDFNTWGEYDQVIGRIFATIESNGTGCGAVYGNFAEELVGATIPILSSKYTQFSKLTAEGSSLMRKLFIQMCTYDLAFLEQNAGMPENVHDAISLVNDLTGFKYIENVEYVDDIHPLTHHPFIESNDPDVDPFPPEDVVDPFVPELPDAITTPAPETDEYAAIIDARIDSPVDGLLVEPPTSGCIIDHLIHDGTLTRNFDDINIEHQMVSGTLTDDPPESSGPPTTDIVISVPSSYIW